MGVKKGLTWVSGSKQKSWPRVVKSGNASFGHVRVGSSIQKIQSEKQISSEFYT